MAEPSAIATGTASPPFRPRMIFGLIRITKHGENFQWKGIKDKFGDHFPAEII